MPVPGTHKPVHGARAGPAFCERGWEGGREGEVNGHSLIPSSKRGTLALVGTCLRDLLRGKQLRGDPYGARVLGDLLEVRVVRTTHGRHYQLAAQPRGMASELDEIEKREHRRVGKPATATVVMRGLTSAGPCERAQSRGGGCGRGCRYRT